jgi:hypothetical protein
VSGPSPSPPPSGLAIGRIRWWPLAAKLDPMEAGARVGSEGVGGREVEVRGSGRRLLSGAANFPHCAATLARATTAGETAAATASSGAAAQPAGATAYAPDVATI